MLYLRSAAALLIVAAVELIALLVIPKFVGGWPSGGITLLQQGFVILAALALSASNFSETLALRRVAVPQFVNYAALPFLIIVPLTWLVSWQSHLPMVMVISPTRGSIADPWLIAAALAIGAPLSEELLFRGYLQSRLASLGVVPASLISSAAWALSHVRLSMLSIVAIFAIGLLLAWILRRTGSLWTCIAAHALINVETAIAVLLFR